MIETTNGATPMTYVIRCDCGTDVKGETEDEIVDNAQDHAKNKHSMVVPRDQALALAEQE